VKQSFYTVEQAAKVLQLTPGRILQRLRAGSYGLSRESAPTREGRHKLSY
jgi:hypothetical protein